MGFEVGRLIPFGSPSLELLEPQNNFFRLVMYSQIRINTFALEEIDANPYVKSHLVQQLL